MAYRRSRSSQRQPFSWNLIKNSLFSQLLPGLLFCTSIKRMLIGWEATFHQFRVFSFLQQVRKTGHHLLAGFTSRVFITNITRPRGLIKDLKASCPPEFVVGFKKGFFFSSGNADRGWLIELDTRGRTKKLCQFLQRDFLVSSSRGCRRSLLTAFTPSSKVGGEGGPNDYWTVTHQKSCDH